MRSLALLVAVGIACTIASPLLSLDGSRADSAFHDRSGASAQQFAPDDFNKEEGVEEQAAPGHGNTEKRSSPAVDTLLRKMRAFVSSRKKTSSTRATPPTAGNQDDPLLYQFVEKLPGEGHVSDEIRNLPRTGSGIIFHAVHVNTTGAPSKYIAELTKTASHVQDVLRADGLSGEIKVLLYTDRDIWMFMNDPNRCDMEIYNECKEFFRFGGSRVFNMVRFYDDFEYPAVPATRPFFEGRPIVWLKRIVALMHSPFDKTMQLDADVYVCPGFAKQFDDYLDERHFYAAVVELGLFSSTRGDPKPLRPDMPDEFLQFPERNLGFQLLFTGKHQVIELLALFRDVYVRQMNDPSIYTLGDQGPFREALFTMRPSIHDIAIPITVGCRFVGGCNDGCLTVHRHWDQDKSGADVEPWSKKYMVHLTDANGN